MHVTPRNFRLPVVLLMFILSGILILQSGCRKELTDEDGDNPKRFVDLKVDPGFEFNSVIELNVTIGLESTAQSGIRVVQIFMGNPATDGKLIATGATDNTYKYQTTIRVPSRLKELYVGSLTREGAVTYVAVPITGTTLAYNFATKSAMTGNSSGETDGPGDCVTGCTQTLLTNQSNLTISSGQVLCVPQGTSISISNSNMAGGTLKICGSVTFSGFNVNAASTIIILATGTVTGNIDQSNLTIKNYSASMNWTVSQITANVENYGGFNVNIGSGNTFNVNGTLTNHGTITTQGHMNVQGTVINNGPFTLNGKVVNNGNGIITNNCSMTLSGSSREFQQNGTLTNNGYINLSGEFSCNGSSTTTTFGQGSLIQCSKFTLQGPIFGPTSQGSQIKATGSSKSKTTSANTNFGYVDLCATAGIQPNNGSAGPGAHLTYCAVTIPAPDCNAPTSPDITSALTAGGSTGQAITPYVITATGTAPITFTATNLPAGLTFSGNTISGTPTAAGTYNITLMADNIAGTDVETLVMTIAQSGTPPAITSPLTATANVNQAFSYTITASGTAPITYTTGTLPAGLTLTNGIISGAPTTAGTYTIPLTATNNAGSDTKDLVLTVNGAIIPPQITSLLTATGTVGTQFNYTITATGTDPIAYNVTNLPAGLTYGGGTAISGTPTLAGTTNVTLTATNEGGSDTKILIITINEGIQPPVITSSLTASGTVNQNFTYTITATGTTPITYNASNLPDGLTFSENSITGIPTAAQTTNVTLTATNSAGSDTKTLVINIVAPSVIDTDGDGVPDSQDAYPLDPTRAFNSYYPNEVDYSTLTYEDLWPSYGDYDCNDLVVAFRYKIVTNAQNKVVDVIGTFQIKAAGASFNNGFGFVLDTEPSNVESVLGCIQVGSAITTDPKGYESGHTTQTVIIPFDAVNTILGRGMVNTVHGGYSVQTTPQEITVHFSDPQISVGTPPYNPFIFVNQSRGKEVHLKDQPPTELVDPSYFGTANDGSIPAQNLYYRSTTALPWAMEIPVNFDYPVENADIVTTYLHFAAWAQSSGASYPDWYLNLTGYRNAANIY
jgi:LruC domain-containing protein